MEKQNKTSITYLSGAGLILWFGCIAALLFSTLAWSQATPVDVYRPMGAQELISQLTEALAKTNDHMPVFIFEGEYEFNELLDNVNLEDTTDNGAKSPVPVIKKDMVFLIGTTALHSFVFNNTTHDIVDQFKVENAFIFVDALFTVLNVSGPRAYQYPDTNLDLALPNNKLDAAPEATANPPIFVGFDTIFNVTNGTVVLNGIRADCGDVCVRGENSRIIVMNSDLECSQGCVRVKNLGTDTNNDPIDFAGLRAGIAASTLPAANKATILANLNRSELLLNDYGVGVVNSKLLSHRNIPVAVLKSDFSVVGGTQVLVDRSILRTDASDESTLLINSQGGGSVVQSSVLSGPNSLLGVLDISAGTVTARNLFIDRGHEGIQLSNASVGLSGSAVSTQGRTPASAESVCKFSLGGGTINTGINSGDYNIVSDDSCNLGGMNDLENTDPGLSLPGDGSLIPQFALNSPAIDGGPPAVANGQLPCGTTDITGLPRPQDGNGDGIAECDVGPVELQQGVDIGPPQSGAFFAFTRDGEGVFVEMLGNGLAVVYIFSYTPDGKFAFWAAGVGKVTRNGIVITKDSFLTTRGGIFGAGFDPATVQRIPFADMSISFPSCANPRNNTGVLAIAANADLGFGPLLSRTERLTSILACNGALPAQLGRGFSGSLSDPLHDGEGIIVQVISATQVVIMWFTYDSFGNQQWITGVGTINGNTITVTDAFIQTGPHYGPTYDKAARVMVIWGDFTVIFEPDCNSAVLNYNSVLAEYGTGTQNLQRLTNLLGVTCNS